MLSVIIPAKNEAYLQKTIENILDNAEGEIEVIAELDGYLPEPQIVINDKRVIFVHHKESIGQRACINHGVSIAKGKYIMKLDAHCAVDKGFDVKLAADCEPEWTIVPRMYNLDIKTFTPKLHKLTDYMYISGPSDEKPFRAMYYGNRQPKSDKLIDDTMCCMGPGWFMHKARFIEQGGCDENHGGWGQQGIEVACKAWLSGGALKVNKKTWFAHWFRGGGGPGFPYKISGNDQEKARKYSRDLWLNDKWPLAKIKFKTMVDKFNPPGWDNRDLTIIFYTANVISDKILVPVVRSLKQHQYPIISISQKPMDLGINYVVPKHRSLQNIYRQVLEGAKKAETKYIALCEDDCLYQPEHFRYRPKKAPFAYNMNRWLLHLDEKVYSYRKRPVLSQCIADREVLIKNLQERMALSEIPDKYCGEMGCFEDKLGMTHYEYETFETKEPNLIICHNKNTSGRKFVGTDAEPRKELSSYGHIDYWLKKFNVSTIYNHRQHSHIGGREFSVNDIFEHLEYFWDWRKTARLPSYKSVVYPFFESIHQGKEFTDEELKAHPYFEYILSRIIPEAREKQGVIDRCMYQIKKSVDLYHDIKKNGFNAPIDMWWEKDKLNLYRGSRRLAIAKLLGYKLIPVRIFNTRELMMKLLPNKNTFYTGEVIAENSITNLTKKQFSKHLYNATDKYWIHNYMRLYDKHIGHLRPTASKVIEIGVKKGASLDIWRQAFPNAMIYGVDKDIKQVSMIQDYSKVKLFEGKQEDGVFMDDVAKHGPFDVIVDDGGHRSKHQIESFNRLWNSLAPGGFYIIEDLYMNYWQDKQEFTNLLKNQIDELNLKCDIKSITFYFNICFIERT